MSEMVGCEPEAGDLATLIAGEGEVSCLVAPDPEQAVIAKLAVCRRSRLAVGASVCVGAIVAYTSWRRFGPCIPLTEVELDGEQSLVSLAESYPADLINLAEVPGDHDALAQWLSAANTASESADGLGADRDVSGTTMEAIDQAMRVTDPEEARTVVVRAMRRSASRIQAKRRDLKTFIRARRRGLGKRTFKRSSTELGPAQEAAVAQCVFNSLSIMDTVASLACNSNDAARTCKYVKFSDIMDMSPQAALKTHARVCSVNIAAVFAGLGSLATSLATATDTCASTLVPNVDALCSASITGLITATSGLAGAGTLITAACTPRGWYHHIPSGMVPSNVGSNYWLTHDVPKHAAEYDAFDKALHPDRDHAPARKLLFGGGKGSTATLCAVEIMDVSWALADAALAINGAANKKDGINSCPPENPIGANHGFVYNVMQSLCLVDIAGALQALLGIIATLQLAVVNCADELNLGAICGAGIDGVFTVLAALAKIAPGLWLACDEAQNPLLKKVLKLAESLDYRSDGMITSLLAGEGSGSAAGPLGRRLQDFVEEYDLPGRIRKLKQRFTSPEEVFQSVGYNITDVDAAFRKRQLPFPTPEEVRSLVEEHPPSADIGSLAGKSFLKGLQTCRA